ncbi:uncharacterized protein CTHT_0020600 [Thermochaetoides thermophila DSM 1495]|uniref:Reverse transcriptase domain-containing protein n=1 Tax=Chaetomium thermophilum (strain DSM 1495 / CBS 144.50 / IMI 039719) TaxID=759272 RepID=G0S3D3_CHATD|nr:hypothetical protein CTHT_0020600 [Thermochaetoides thermophila DSM 1495]EGS22516.1 hypothetical protein CTHT_0020600 [Thermochaetoides thermophila DSM 1495]
MPNAPSPTWTVYSNGWSNTVTRLYASKSRWSSLASIGNKRSQARSGLSVGQAHDNGWASFGALAINCGGSCAIQGYHGLLVTLDVVSAYPSVQPAILSEVLADQGWSDWVCRITADFCLDQRFSFEWAQTTFRSDTGLPQGSPWSPILFMPYCLPFITPPQPESSFMYMDDQAQLTWSKNLVQMAHHTSLRDAQLCTKIQGLGL